MDGWVDIWADWFGGWLYGWMDKRAENLTGKWTAIQTDCAVWLLEKWLNSPLTQSSFAGKSRLKADSSFSENRAPKM